MRPCCDCQRPVPDDIEICVSCYRKYKKSVRESSKLNEKGAKQK